MRPPLNVHRLSEPRRVAGDLAPALCEDKGTAQHAAGEPARVGRQPTGLERPEHPVDIAGGELGELHSADARDDVAADDPPVVLGRGGLDRRGQAVAQPALEVVAYRQAPADHRQPDVELGVEPAQLLSRLGSRLAVDELSLALALDPAEIDRALPAPVGAPADPPFTAPSSPRHRYLLAQGSAVPTRSRRTRRAAGQRSCDAAARTPSISSRSAPARPSGAGGGRSGGRWRARYMAWRWAGEQYSGAGPRRDGTSVSVPHQRQMTLRLSRSATIYRSLYLSRRGDAAQVTQDAGQTSGRGRRAAT